MSDNVGDAVYGVLSGYTPITDIVSTRIEPVDIPQDATLPWIVYRVVSGESVNSLAGQSGAIDYLVQIDCFSKDYNQAATLGELVRVLFGNIRKAYHNNAFVLSANIRGIRDLPAGPEPGSEEVIHARSVDVQIWLGVAKE